MKLPVTRYYGSKRRVVDAIWEKLQEHHIEFNSFLDLFGGTGIVSYYMLAKGKTVIYNDIFRFNCVNAKALLATPRNTMSENVALSLLIRRVNVNYNNIIERNFNGIYYTQPENRQIDTIVQNIHLLPKRQQACGYYLLNQACLIKRPFNLFHRNNLGLRLNHKVSKFGNYVTWEKSFEILFRQFIKELNTFEFEDPDRIKIVNQNALDCNETADIVYIDTPYFNNKSTISYHSRYHFLEGLQYYDKIEQYINHEKINKEIELNINKDFELKSRYIENLRILFEKYKDTTIVMSYTSKGYPSVDSLINIMGEYKHTVIKESLGNQSFALNRDNKDREEVIIIGD